MAVLTGACAGAATIEPAPLPEPLVAVAEESGVRLSLALASVPTRRAAVWADVVVENLDQRPIAWVRSWCGDVADVTVDVTPAFRAGLRWQGRLGMVKDRIATTSSVVGQFVPEAVLPPRGNGLCDALFDVEQAPAAATLHARPTWDGGISFQGIFPPRPAPPGPATIRASFAFVGRLLPGRPAPDPGITQPVEVTLETQILPAPGDSTLAPGEAVDAALADPVFAAMVQASDEERWVDVSIAMRGDEWTVRMLRQKPGDRPENGWLSEIRVGPHGEIRGRRMDVPVPGDCPDPTIC